MMRRYLIRVSGLALVSATLLSGCATQPPLRTESVSFAAGDAIAANTAMQVVDPWDENVRYTDIAVPADREQYLRRVQASGNQAAGGTNTQSGGMTSQ